MSKRWRNRHHVGRIRIKLAELLTAQGYETYGDDLIPNQGWPRSHPEHFDQQPWCGYGLVPNHGELPESIRKVHFMSWDTMTECVRYGISLEPESGYNELLVHANFPGKPKGGIQ